MLNRAGTGFYTGYFRFLFEMSLGNIQLTSSIINIVHWKVNVAYNLCFQHKSNNVKIAILRLLRKCRIWTRLVWPWNTVTQYIVIILSCVVSNFMPLRSIHSRSVSCCASDNKTIFHLPNVLDYCIKRTDRSRYQQTAISYSRLARYLSSYVWYIV